MSMLVGLSHAHSQAQLTQVESTTFLCGPGTFHLSMNLNIGCHPAIINMEITDWPVAQGASEAQKLIDSNACRSTLGRREAEGLGSKGVGA